MSGMSRIGATGKGNNKFKCHGRRDLVTAPPMAFRRGKGIGI